MGDTRPLFTGLLPFLFLSFYAPIYIGADKNGNGAKSFLSAAVFRVSDKNGKFGDLLIYAVFESYKRDFTDKIEVKNPNFVQALDKNVFVQFCPLIYRLSIGTMSLSVSPKGLSPQKNVLERRTY